MDRYERETREEMAQLVKDAGIYGWTKRMVTEYKELMEKVGEDPSDFHCNPI
jgi:hypothetical protein